MKRFIAPALVLLATACDVEARRVQEQRQDPILLAGFNGAGYSVPAVPAQMPARRAEFQAADSARPARTLSGSTVSPARMVIRNAEVSIRVDSLAPALERARRVATAVGGLIGSSWEETGDAQRRSFTLELRVPSERLEQAVEGLRRIGTVETVRISASDVGEEYVDTDARMRTARALESRLLQVLATRAGRLDYVLQVENELARVREQIERFEGRMRYLREHAAWSTITATVHEPYTVVGDPGPGVLRGAFERSWENFVWLLALAIQSLGVVLPLGLAALTGWKLIKRQRPLATAPATLPAPLASAPTP